MSIFAASFVMSEDSQDMNNALQIAKSGAECYKAVFGDAEKAALILGGAYPDNEVRVYYDHARRSCEENAAVYTLRIMLQSDHDAKTLIVGDLSVEKNSGEEIIAFTVAARREP